MQYCLTSPLHVSNSTNWEESNFLEGKRLSPENSSPSSHLSDLNSLFPRHSHVSHGLFIYLHREEKTEHNVLEWLFGRHHCCWFFINTFLFTTKIFLEMFYAWAILFPPLQSLPVKQRIMNILALPSFIITQHILISRFPFKVSGFVYILVTQLSLQQFHLKENLMYSTK